MSCLAIQRMSKGMQWDLGVYDASLFGEPQASKDTGDDMLEHDESTALYRDLDAPEEEVADPYAGGYKASLKAFDERCGRVVPPEEGATGLNPYGSNLQENSAGAFE